MNKNQNINTLGQLKKTNYQFVSIKDELRNNLISKLKNKESIFKEIYGYEETVIPELERAILRFLKAKKANLSPEHIAGKFDGYSESWTIDSYKVNNLKELIDKASEAGF